MEYIKYIYEAIKSFFSSVGSVLSYIWSIFQSLRYGLTTLLSGVGDMINDLFTTGIFDEVSTVFNQISAYLGGWATTFIATMLFIIMFRIGIGFVFKIFRMDLRYDALKKRIKLKK